MISPNVRKVSVQRNMVHGNKNFPSWLKREITIETGFSEILFANRDKQTIGYT